MSSELDTLALEAAKVLVDALVQDGWAATRKRLGYLIGNRKKQARESAAAIARAQGKDDAAVVEAETQAWARRIRVQLDDDPHGPAAVRALLQQPAVGQPTNFAAVTGSSQVTISQKTSNVKISVPVIGPFISLASAHPIAAAVTVVAIAGTGVGGAQLARSLSSGPETFHMVTGSGYDFSQVPPRMTSVTAPSALRYTGPEPLAIVNEAIGAISSNIARFSGPGKPTATACRADVNAHAAEAVPIRAGSVVCFINQSGESGYIKVISVIPQYATVAAVLLPSR